MKLTDSHGSVNNGSRVYVELPDFIGFAGLVERSALAYLSYRSTEASPKKRPDIGPAVTIDGKAWPVVATSNDTMNEGFRTIVLRKET